MSARWQYRVAVGDADGNPTADWITYSDDPAPTDYTTDGQPGLVLDGLKLTRKLPEDDVWPCQPTPATLTFQVAAATAAELAAMITKGSPVAFRLGQFGGVVWHAEEVFTGYVTTAIPEARGGYTVSTVTAVGWVTALGEVIIGDDPWPLEGAPNRISRVFAQVFEHAPELPADWDYDRRSDEPPAGSHVAMTDADVDARPALEVLLETLACWPIGEFVNPSAPDLGRYQLAEHFDTYDDDSTDGFGGAGVFTNLLHVDGWRIRGEPVATSDAPPGTLVELTPGGLWGIHLSPAGSRALTAGTVEVPVRWAQRIGDIPNTAVVTAHFEGYTAGQEKFTLRWALPEAERKPRVRIARTVPLEFATTDDATYQSGVDATFKLAMILIPNTVNPQTSWVADELTYRAELEAGYSAWAFQLGHMITITDVDPDAHPAATPWIHGQTVAYTMTVSDGLPVVEFTLAPMVRDSIHADAMEMADIPATPSLAQLDPDMSLNDLRLLGV